VLAAAAWADAVTDAADAAARAFAAGDQAALKALAEKDDPDPWLVADELCARGAHEAALAFANAAPRKTTEKLPAHLAASPNRPSDAQAREALVAAAAALAAGPAGDAQRALDGVRAEAGTLFSARLLKARGEVLRTLERLEESAQASLEGAREAEAIGWLRGAVEMLDTAARVHAARSDFRAEVAALERCLAVTETAGLRLAKFGVLVSLGSAHLNLGLYRQALGHYERALEFAEALGHRRGIAVALACIGRVQSSLGSHALALQYLKRALTAQEELNDRAEVAKLLSHIGITQYNLQAYAQALEHHGRALRLQEDMGDRAGAARTVGNMGVVHRSLGQFAQALEHHERALKLKEELGDRAGTAMTLNNMGSVHSALGSQAAALACYERALGIRQELNDRPGTATNLDLLAGVHWSRGSYASAVGYCERALKLHEEMEDRVGTAKTLLTLGVIYCELGSYARALDYEMRSLRLREEIGDRPGVAVILGNIGNLYCALGSYRQALEHHERALKIEEELGNRGGMAGTLANIGLVCSNMDSDTQALAYLERALEIQEGLGDRPGAARTLGHIGGAHRRLGSYAQALEYFGRALRLQETLGDLLGTARTLRGIADVHGSLGSYARAGEYHERARALAAEMGALEEEVGSLWGLAEAHLAQGDAREAARRAREAVDELPLLEGRLPEELGAFARQKWNGLLDVGVRAALVLDDAEEACFFLESDRAAGLLEALGGRQTLRDTVIPEQLAAAEQGARASLAAARARQDRANGTGNRAEIQAAHEELERAQSRMLEKVAEVQRAAKAKADVAYPRARPLGAIRGRLRDGEALVLYGLTPDSSVALVATREGSRLQRLARQEEIEHLCASISAEKADVPALRRALVEPLALPAGARRILISPDDALARVPFALLIPERELAYVPSGTTYDVLCDERELRGRGVLAVGDPDYGVPVAMRGADVLLGTGLTPLPATREEAKAVGDVVLLGQDATPASLFLEISRRPRWRAVHIACHGLMDPERPLLSSLALTGGDIATLDIFRSAIAADLVVLSACETAKGKVYRSEGVVGFVRAFMFAGAPRVIVSLWKVDDDATRALMVKFYERWKGGAGAARALKEAQEHVAAQERWSHPKYWAAWQLWGLPE
jgi:CHAT domain-containing protein/Tfp pilus assembly protein PilF